MDDERFPIAFVGCGAAGRALGRALREAGFEPAGVCCRTRASAEAACAFMGGGRAAELADAASRVAPSADVVIVATPDREIAGADARIAPGLRRGAKVLHLSGGLPSSVLAKSKQRGAAVGSMHPLQSFADPERARQALPGSLFACEGDEAAVAAAFTLAAAVGGRPVRIETRRKPLYHAAAAAASNFLIAPLLLSLDLMETAGLDRAEALRALRPLIEGTVKNALALGVPRALTGPIERNDRLVVESHLQAIEAECPQWMEPYRGLARLVVEAARRKGSLSAEDAARMLEVLEGGPAEG